MTAFGDRVRAFLLRLAPNPACDGCIAERLAVAPSQVNQETRTLAGHDGFERRRDICSLCFGEKVVVRRTPR